MMLEKTEIENFQPFRDTVPISFNTTEDSPITLIRAKNDRGKTAFLRAITFCLYGFEDREIRDSCINRQAAVQGDGQTRVSVTFRHEGRRYRIERGFEFEEVDDAGKREAKDDPTVTVAFLDEDYEFDSYIVKPNATASRYNEFIGDILPENASQYFFFDGEKLEEYAQSFGEDDEKVKAAIEYVLGIREIQKAIDDLGTYGVDYYDDKWKEAESDLEELNELRDELENIEDQLEDQRSKRDSIRSNIKDQEDELERVKDQISEAGEVEDKRQQIVDIDKEIEADGGLNDQIEEKRLDQHDLVRQLGPLAAVSGAEYARPQIEVDLDSGETGVVQKILESTTCICTRPLKEKHRKHFRGYLRQLTDESAQKMIHLRDAIDDHLDRVDSSDVDDAKDDFSSLSDEIDELKQRRSDLRTEQERLQSIIDSVGVGEDELEELRQERDEINQEIGRLEGELENIRDNINQTIEDREEIEKQIDEVEGVADDVERYRGLRGLARSSRQAWKDIREDYVKSRRLAVQDHAESVFLQLTNKPDVYTGLEISESYQLQIETTSGKRRFEDQDPSTGARQIIAYSFIAGLNKYTARDAPVIIDTPVARLDQVHRQNLLEYLPDFQDQVVILYQPSEIVDEDLGIIRDAVSDHYRICQGDDPETSDIECYGPDDDGGDD